MVFFVKGTLERILANCSRYYNQGSTSPLTEKAKQEFYKEASMMGTTGLRGRFPRGEGLTGVFLRVRD